MNEYKGKVSFDPVLFDNFGTFKRVNLKEMFKTVSNKNHFFDLLLKMLCYLPEKRITAKEALSHAYFNDIAETKKSEKTVKK